MIFRRVKDGIRTPTEPGTYQRVVEVWGKYHLSKPNAKFWAECCCPACGKVSLIGRHHDVSSSGIVSPSYVCPFPPCAFHEFVRLDDWERPGPCQPNRDPERDTLSAMEFQRWYGPTENTPPGFYRRAQKATGDIAASVCCPECRLRFVIVDHRVDMNGYVTPSVVCPNVKKGLCSFHPNACWLRDILAPMTEIDLDDIEDEAEEIDPIQLARQEVSAFDAVKCCVYDTICINPKLCADTSAENGIPTCCAGVVENTEELDTRDPACEILGKHARNCECSGTMRGPIS